MKTYISYTATIRMWNDNKNEVKEMKFDHPDIKTLKENIKFVFNSNRAEYNGEYSISIEKYELLSIGMCWCGRCEYTIKDDKLYII